MSIRQFNMQFDPEQDRILFRMNTAASEEFRFYFTRRFVKLLWPVLLRMMENDFKKQEPQQAHLAKDMLAFEHAAMMSKANFKQQFVEAKTYPLGEEPILLSKIQVIPGPHADTLALHPSVGQGINMSMNRAILHSFTELLKATVIKADWGLESLIQTEYMVSRDTKKILH